MEEAQVLKTAVDVAKAPVEIVKIPFQGGSMIFQAIMSGAFGMSSIVQFAQMYQNKMNLEKAVGGSDLETLLKVSGGDVHLIQAPKNRLEEVHQALTEWEVPHAFAPDLNPYDNFGEIMIPTNSVPRVNVILQKLGFGQTESPEEYIQNADPETLQQMTTNAASEAPTTKLTSSMLQEQQFMQQSNVTKDVPEDQKQFMERLQISDLMNDPEKQGFSINKESLIKSQDESTILTRIPGTQDYVRFHNTHAFEFDDGKTVLLFEDKNAQVDILNANQEDTHSMNFGELHRLHFDRIRDLSKNRALQPAKVQAAPIQTGGGIV